MTTTPQLGLPLLAAAQAQKHVTHNEALFALDALVQCAIRDKDLSAPPGSPAEGDRYIVGLAPTGLWAGKANLIVLRHDGAWLTITPQIGFIAYVIDEALLYVFTSGGWKALTDALTAIQNLGRLGIGTTADAANPFSAKLNAALWTARGAGEGGTGDLRYTLNKESAANILSLLFQTGYSGRLEIGLVGSDNLVAKVSANGTTWRQALAIDAGTGAVDVLSPEATIASAATVDLGAQASRRLAITGTTTITSFGTGPDKERILRFVGVLTITHNATSLILPGGANIVTAAGDTVLAVSDGAGNWRLIGYQRAAVAPGSTSPASVTNAMLANMPTATIKGRATAGTGSPEDLTATQARGVLGLATTDAVTFRSVTAATNVENTYSTTMSFRSTSGDFGVVARIGADAASTRLAIESFVPGTPGSKRPICLTPYGGGVSIGTENAPVGMLDVAGAMTVRGAVTPGTDTALTLGTASLRWSEAFAAKFAVDPNFYSLLSASNPTVVFDANDFNYYDRTSNTYWWRIGNLNKFAIDGAGVYPGADNNQALGAASLRWSMVYAGTGTINTSDQTTKTPLRGFTDAELDAWGAVNGGVFQFLDSLAEKGEDHARLHFGYTAQAVEAAFEAHDVDPRRCALWCSDELIERVEKTRLVERPAIILLGRTRSVERQKVERVQEPVTAVAIVDGKPVQTTATQEVEKPVFEMVAVVDAEGEPVTRDEDEFDANGVLLGTRSVAVMHPVPVMETVEEAYEEAVETTEEVEETYTEEVKIGETRLGLRYDQCAVIEGAYQRRRAERLEARMAAIEAALAA